LFSSRLRAPDDCDQLFRLMRPGVSIDRDHLFQAIATSLWTEVIGAVG